VIWRNGKFRWSFVVALAYFALSIYLFDFAWRVVNVGFIKLVLISGSAFAVGAALLIWFFLSRRAHD